MSQVRMESTAAVAAEGLAGLRVQAGRWLAWVGAGARWEAGALAGLMLVAAALRFWRLGDVGYGNLYYAASVKSMLGGWHNAFFVSFDPGGFVSVDKPPLGLWVQAASAWLLGFSGFSLLLPQALAGALSVLVLYHLLRRSFGVAAGLIAAAVLALAPINVAADRNNTMDSQLVLTSLVGAWAVLRAVDSGKLRWLLLSAAMVGVGFNIKMLQAVMVLPAIYLVYLAAAPAGLVRKVAHLCVATVVLLAVSLSWAAAVDLTPADQRPFVGSSRDNTVRELILGHNGIERLGKLAQVVGLEVRRRGPGPSDAPGIIPATVPNQGPIPPYGPAPQGPIPGQRPAGQAPPGQPPLRPAQPGAAQGQPSQPAPGTGQPVPGQQPPNQAIPGAGQPVGPGGATGETGAPGMFRLFNRQLAGQATWLLPLATVGLVMALPPLLLRRSPAGEWQAALLWAGWLMPQLIFFSYAGLFHRYYLGILSPAIAAGVAITLVLLWREYRRGGALRFLLPAGLLASAALQALILSDFPDWSRWLTPLVLGLTGAAVLALLIGLVRPGRAVVPLSAAFAARSWRC